MNKTFTIAIIILVVAFLGLLFLKLNDDGVIEDVQVSNFDECVAVGNAVMESYPRQCKNGEEVFVEDIGNELEKTDLIRLDSPRPNDIISSPLTITGKARGMWFFEASFPVMLVNMDGQVIAQGIATATDDWMTKDFVPFTATIDFDIEQSGENKGMLILQKDNPSGLPENNDALRIPVFFDFSLNTSQGIKEFDSGSIYGQVVRGPICPVMREENEEACANEPYQTTINVYWTASSKSSPYASVKTDKDGNYSFVLRPGLYTIEAEGGNPFPSCNKSDFITVEAGEMIKVNILCDTGIR